MSLALYRKYRPKTLESLMGHESTVALLQNAAKNDRLGQAYLFYGPRGTGKTTTARLIAKLLNCETREADLKFRAQGEPCNKCRSCKEIDELRSLDVMEIDAASNRGIDEIRNLKENIRTAPSGSKYKVYIIDEAHMLTGAAFNALLKTLEEPPSHAAFILATTEYEKIPATITSRVQRFGFKKIPVVTIIKKLSEITKKEKVSIDAEALELIASVAEGSMRDAESLLDQLSALAERINLATAEEFVGRTGFKKIERLAELITRGDLEETLANLSSLADTGVDLVQCAKDLIHYFRKLLTIRLSPKSESSLALELTKEELNRLKNLAKEINPTTLAPFMKALIRAYAEMRYSPFAIIPLEIAITEYLSKNKTV